MQKIVIIGGSNAFWEIDELVNDINAINPTYEIIGVLDDNPNFYGKHFNNLILDGPLEKVKLFNDDVKFVFAIGSNKTRLIRAQILERLNIPIERFETIIHPTAKIYSTAKIGYGCIIHYGTVVYNHTIIDSLVVISSNCVIAVGNYIGKCALLGSNITTTTGVYIGDYSFIGSSTSIGENIEIGPGALIGMGSLILRKVSPGMVIIGNPPKILDKVAISEKIINEWENRKKLVIINKN